MDLQQTKSCEACGAVITRTMGRSAKQWASRRFCNVVCKADFYRRDELDRFWEHVNKNGPIHPELGRCWLWTGEPHHSGYGMFWISRNGKRNGLVAHKYAYEATGRSVPDGLVLDHLCRNRACVNPDHLEPVTNRVNVLRGEHPNVLTHRTGVCRQGHALTNPKIDKKGRARCRECFNFQWRKNHRRRKEQRKAKGLSS